ncbi:MAG: FAD-binding oxidoreductase [Enterovirga sp.]|nr:FAD-binding oxidoreductase [Enterovirga sp.]
MKSDPYWWDAAPLRTTVPVPVAQTADVVVVGAGYTGLSAAITLARAGRSVLVFDRQRPGEGASSRNGGITSGNLRPSLAEMTRSFGEERAKAILAESKLAREDLYRFIAEEKIACDFALTGRFAGAAAPGDYDGLARDADYLREAFGIEAYAVPRSEQRDVLGTRYYYGGNVRMDIGGLHPGKLHAEMLRVALAAGAVLHAETAISGIVQEADGYRVTTSRGTVKARDVIVGTNGYTDGSNSWLRRRLVPLRSRIIATEPLSPNLMGELMPRRMMISDTRNLSYYYRPSPDGTRILFGGRDGTRAGDPSEPTDRLRATMVELFPELAETEITHSWFGYVAMNRDMVPRIFSRDGMRYATGYCGSGVVWARWAGRKAALQVLGQDGSSALDFRPPPAVPFYTGRPWFIPPYMAWLTLQDRRKARTRTEG